MPGPWEPTNLAAHLILPHLCNRSGVHVLGYGTVGDEGRFHAGKPPEYIPMSVPNVPRDISHIQVEDLKGKGAIVTGGGSGISLAFTRHLYQAGCNVLICDLGLHREAQSWLESLPKAPDATPRIVFTKTDVTDWKQLEHAFDVYATEFGGVPDVLCPGAGIYEPSAPNFWNDKDDDGYKILRINLEHPIKMSRIAIRKWVQAGQPGNIILISSTGAQKSSILTPLYGAAKQGISNFARAMAPLQSMENIRVTAVAPGPTMSPLMYDHPEAIRFVDPEKDKLATTDEIARGMMALCFEGKFAAGTVLEVTHPDRWREVSLLNDPGPGAHAFTSRKDDAIVDVKAALDADRARKR